MKTISARLFIILVIVQLLIFGSIRAQASLIRQAAAVPASLIYSVSFNQEEVQTFSVSGKNVGPTLVALEGISRIAYGPSGVFYALSSSGGSGGYITTYDKYGREKQPTITVPFTGTDLKVGPQGLLYLVSVDYQNFRSTITAYYGNGAPTKLSISQSITNLDPLIALDAQGDLYVLSQSTYSQPHVQEYTAGGVPIGRPFAIDVCSGFVAANDMTFDRFGKLYIATQGCGVEEFTAKGVLTSPTIGVTATDIAVNASGTIYVYGSPNNVETVQTFNRSGTQILPQISLGYGDSYGGLALDPSGDIHVGTGSAVLSFSPKGVRTAPTIIGELGEPVGVAVDSAGQIFVESFTGAAIGGFVSAFSIDGIFSDLRFGHFAPNLGLNSIKVSGNTLILADGNIRVSNNIAYCEIYEFTTAGKPIKLIPVITSTGIGGLAVDSSGKLYVTTGENELQTYTAAGVRSRLTIPLLNQPAGVAVDSHGKIYVVNKGTNSVNTYTASGQPTTPVITGLNVPSDIAVDAVGNIFVSTVGDGGPFEGAISEYTSRGAFVRAITDIDGAYAIAIR